jgi:hypothetical protein
MDKELDTLVVVVSDLEIVCCWGMWNIGVVVVKSLFVP